MADPELRARLVSQITGAWSTQVIGVAAQLKLFDALGDRPRAAAELAAESGSHPGALHRLLRALGALGLVSDLGGGKFELTDAGRLLCEGAPGGLRGMALHWGDRLWGALSQLDQSVKTGKPWRISGAEGFEHMARDPQQMAMFHQSMADSTAPVAHAVIEAYDFSAFAQVMDVGGSTGALMAAILKAHPRLHGCVFDLPGLAEAAEAYLRAQGVADRAAFVGGSFFEAVPAGAELIMMKMIIHDWLDDEAALILANTRKALAPGAVLLVMDRVAPEVVSATAADYGALRADITMLTAAGGKERTGAEFEALFARAGLRLRRIVATTSEFSILESVPA
jgi:hypothetical protein